jgi:hypothetical protein
MHEESLQIRECPACRGMNRCQACDGLGMTTDGDHGSPGECQACEGAGVCALCAGAGLVPVLEGALS